MSPLLTVSLWTAATLLPDWELTGNELPLHIVATDNRDALYRLAFDPLTLRSTRVASLRGLVDLMSRPKRPPPPGRTCRTPCGAASTRPATTC